MVNYMKLYITCMCMYCVCAHVCAHVCVDFATERSSLFTYKSGPHYVALAGLEAHIDQVAF